LRDALQRNAPLWSPTIWASIWPLLISGVVSIPLGLWVFGIAERYAKRTGKLKRNG
jgi:ABC-2 type transport system permease protein